MSQFQELTTEAMKFILGGVSGGNPTSNATIICGGPDHGTVKDDAPVDDSISTI